MRLPHTGLVVGRIGLGSSFGVGPDDLELAFDHGINYFYWGSVRRPGFGAGIRRLAERHREKIVVTLQSYARWPAGLLHRGKVRHLMMSGHERRFFPVMALEDIFDLFMVRYNAAHRGAEKDVFPDLPSGDGKPAICAYTATRWRSLLDPRKTPPGERTPMAGDCYRFCLSHPDVDMTLCGPSTTDHVREACDALAKGAMSEDELAWMRRVGDHVYGRSPVRAVAD